MGYKDRLRQVAYQREWIANRRASYFKDKSCVRCKTTERLELDHIDPSTKEHHAIWSWSAERREHEIVKCQVLCHGCHLEKTRQENREKANTLPRVNGRFSKGSQNHRK